MQFPRDADGLDALRCEAALLAVLRPRLTIAVPEMEVIEQPLLFTRHRLLPGDALLEEDYARLDDGQRTRLARDIATFLAELHAIDGDWAAIGVDAGDEDFNADEIARATRGLLPAALHAAADRILAAHAELGPDPLGTGLCYLDAHGWNFAFDAREGRLNGIFDFGDAALAARHEEFVEPAYVSRDLARRVIEAYRDVTGRSVDQTRVETLIGAQRLIELAEDCDHPQHGDKVRRQAVDWLSSPTL